MGGIFIETPLNWVNKQNLFQPNLHQPFEINSNSDWFYVNSAWVRGSKLLVGQAQYDEAFTNVESVDQLSSIGHGKYGGHSLGELWAGTIQLYNGVISISNIWLVLRCWTTEYWAVSSEWGENITATTVVLPRRTITEIINYSRYLLGSTCNSTPAAECVIILWEGQERKDWKSQN